MKGFARAAALSFVLLAAPTFAQTPAPAQPAPKPATPTTPAPPAQTQPAPAPKPFPEGAKIAYINIQRIANESSEGKAATAKVQALVQKKQAEANEKNKMVQADQAKLASGGSVMSEAARTELEKKIERQNVELQRATQDAQQEVQELQQQLQNEFQERLTPVLQQVAADMGLHFVFNGPDAGLVWADQALDISAEVIKKLDLAAGKPAPKPAPTKPPGQ